MHIRKLGMRATEIEAAGMRFLLTDLVPVAYTDGAQWFRAEPRLHKAETQHQNEWFKRNEVTKYREVSRSAVLEAFANVTEIRYDGRREEDQPDSTVIMRIWKLEQRLDQMAAKLDRMVIP
jgi:hypothetical protein